MNPIAALLPIITVLLLYAAYLRLSARMVRSTITSKHALAFAAIMGVLAILGRVLSTSQLGAFPVPFSIFLGAGFHLLLGGWYFRNRARNAEGHPLGWR